LKIVKKLEMAFKCVSCESKFTRKCNLEKHFNRKHLGGEKIVKNCFLCGQLFPSDEVLDDHIQNYHKPSEYFVRKESAFKRAGVIYYYIYNSNIITPSEAQNTFIKNEIKKVIYHEALQKNVVKFSLVFLADMVMRDSKNNVAARAPNYFRSKSYTAAITNKDAIKNHILNAIEDQLINIDSFINNGSNWIFHKAIAMDIEIGGVNPIFIGSNNKNIVVDIRHIKNKKHLVNVPSKENKCFLYCIAESLYGCKIKDKSSTKYYEKYLNLFDVDGIDFPITLKHIRKFVQKNEKLDLSINILFLSGKNIYPLECGIGAGRTIVNLLSIPIEGEEKAEYHFLVIKNLDKFLSKVYRSDEKRNYYENAFYCPNCFNKFTTKQCREKHVRNCFLQKGQIEKIPSEKDGNDKIFFTKYENQFFQDIVGYLDFECSMNKIEDICDICKTIRCKCDMSYTCIDHEQKAMGFTFFVVNKENEMLCFKTFSGENAGVVFLDYLFEQEKTWIFNYLHKIKPMRDLTDEEIILFETSEKCYICNRDFSEDDPKVRDHDHSDSFFISAAHNSCNLRRKRQKSLKIFMHNGSKYDFHILVKNLAKRELKNLYILPYNMENFRMVKFNSFMLVDSLAFLQNSLSKLADELKESGHDYPILKQSDIVKTNGYFDNDKFQMILQKGFFPYEFW